MLWSRRATVLGETAMPSLASSSAMVVVVRRDQRKSVMGSPAVSCSSRPWRTAIMLGVFFRGCTTTAGAAGSAADHILIQQLLPTAGHGMHLQAQEITQQSVPAMAQADGTPTRQTIGAVVHPAGHRTEGWRPNGRPRERPEHYAGRASVGGAGWTPWRYRETGPRLRFVPSAVAE